MLHKKIFTIIPCALALTLLTACGSHAHSAEGGWVSDLENHWHECDECGEIFDTAAHTLENDVCTVCGSEIVTFEDGTKMLTAYNEYGDCTRFVFYANDGSVESEDRYEHEYDADGNKVRETTYINGVLTSEYQYAQSAGGELYMTGDSYYYEDGTQSVNVYDEAGNILRSVFYASDGSVESEYQYEYSVDGSWMGEKEYYGDTLTVEREYSVDADGWQKLLKDITYHEDGSWVGVEYDLYENEVIEIYSDAEGNVELDRRYEHTYDADGNKTLTKTYENGILTEETEYFVGSDEDGSWSMSGKTTIYHEDGSKTVSDRDLEGTWSSEIIYDANGNVMEEVRYEYEYNEEGDSTGSKGYKNGNLFEEVQTIVDSDGEVTGVLMISYDEDGTKTISEYDDTFTLVKETVYDAAGNVISES